MKKVFTILLLFLICTSCATMDKEDRIVRRQDFFNRFSRNELYAMQGWTMGSDFLKLRKNKTFIYQSRIFGLANSGYYCGEYQLQNDTIKLTFINNNKPQKLKSEMLVFKKREGEDILDNCNGYFFYILKNKLAVN